MVEIEKIGDINDGSHYVELTLKPAKPVSYDGNRGYKSTLFSVIVIKYQDAS